MRHKTSYAGRLVAALLLTTLLTFAPGFVPPEAAAHPAGTLRARRGSTGQTFPSNAYNMTGVGSCGQGVTYCAWVSPSAALTDNGSSAKASIGAARSTTTNYLVVTGFSLAVPAGQTVTSVVVQIKRTTADAFIPYTSITDNVVSLVKDGAVVGPNKADTTTVWPVSTYQVATYTFSQSDLSGFSAADFNSGNFGVALSANLHFSDEEESPYGTARVEYISVNVYYS